MEVDLGITVTLWQKNGSDVASLVIPWLNMGMVVEMAHAGSNLPWLVEEKITFVSEQLLLPSL